MMRGQKENNTPDIVEAIRSHDRDRKQRMLAEETQEEREARLTRRRSLYHQNKAKETDEQRTCPRDFNDFSKRVGCT
ncbi:7775_t:CDS:2, partial [Dentiscutata heterogama]